MARQRPIVPIRQHYSRDLKNRVIYQYYTLQLNTSEISVNLNMMLRVVQRAIQNWNEIGDVCRERRGRGRCRILSSHNMQFLIAVVDRTPDIYLDEIQQELLTQHGVDMSIGTIHNSLKRLGYSSKKLTRQAAERQQERRDEFFLKVGCIPPEYLVCADESAVNILTTYRTNGWSTKGLRAWKTAKFVRGVWCVSTACFFTTTD
ncbi:hypothetical protein K435DRAFT_702093 [Dendrothele bispora CBS 962.96]|uniref:Winged helix-turn helix domain-containing protein n=1 Tax=Dendrothele bispora (strain CBS 962.96) TaxID=1314807 RepID=A0A4S8KPM5_DENBC|nr:hypothetical protein K435DRAFT_702093 [Dendrothele bispora CBS 962.96]